MTTIEPSFLIFDDKSDNYFIARRAQSELKTEFHDMEIGETRMMSDNVGIIRDA